LTVISKPERSKAPRLRLMTYTSHWRSNWALKSWFAPNPKLNSTRIFLSHFCNGRRICSY
jgi:hypothetical protein